MGNFETVLRSGKFAVTAETSPPDAADEGAVLARAGCLKGVVDAVNVTDGAAARAHMSALAAAAVLARHGIEPVLQLTTRDRNRLALQGDLLGAAVLGIPNILCLGGDDVAAGDQPETKAVHDLDTRGLVETARRMRDEGRFPSGRTIDPAPRLFIGTVDTPHDPQPDFTTANMQAKIDAGAGFFQTQFAFDTDILKRYMERLWQDSIPEKAYFIVGIGPVASAKSARWMNDNLAGVHVPDSVIERLQGAKDERAEGRRICVELLQQLAEIKGVHGAHLMGPNVEQDVAEVVKQSGVCDGRG